MNEQQLRDEITQLKTALTIKNGTIEQLTERVAELEAHQVNTLQPALTVWEGAMPESNGKSNFTAVLMRKGADLFDGIAGGITLARSEYPDRVRYEADRVRYLIGELDSEPFILDYDADKHSGYVEPLRENQQEPVAWVNPKDLVQDGYSHTFAAYSEQYAGFTPLYTKHSLLKECNVTYSTSTPAPARQVPEGFRVMEPTGRAIRNGERWEVYAPCGSGGIVREDDIADPIVRQLLDALAAAPQAEQSQDSNEIGRALRKLADEFKEAWPEHNGKYLFLVGAGDSIAASARLEPDALSREVEQMVTALESGEWADHLGQTELGGRMESAITKLVNQAAMAVPDSGWIACSERLPEIDMDAAEYAREVSVIAWSKGWSKPRQLRYCSNGYAKTEKGRAPRWEEMRGCLAFSQPTHWRPLPVAPAISPDQTGGA